MCNNVSRGIIFGKGLIDHGMWLPATFPEFSLSADSLAQGTFKAGGEKKGVRIDYVAVSDTIDAQRNSAKVLHGIDLSGMSEDHHPVAVTIRCSNGGGSAPFRIRKCRHNRLKPRTQPHAADDLDLIEKMPLVRHDTEPTTHQHIFTNNLEASLQKFAGHRYRYPSCSTSIRTRSLFVRSKASS